jgi:hypothetical protein
MHIRRPLTGALVAATVHVSIASSAKAYSWWSGWDSYAECMDYYTKNPPDPTGYSCAGVGGCRQYHVTAELLCSVKKPKRMQSSASSKK